MREIIGRRRRHDHQEMLSTSPTGVPPPSAMAVSQFSQARSSTGRIIAPYTVTKHPPLQKKKWTKHRKKEGKNQEPVEDNQWPSNVAIHPNFDVSDWVEPKLVSCACYTWSTHA